MDVNAFLERLRLSRDYRGQIAHIERLPARPARFADLSKPLPDPLPSVLESTGIQQLYSHQVTAIALRASAAPATAKKTPSATSHASLVRRGGESGVAR